jgi:hypothetical protein
VNGSQQLYAMTGAGLFMQYAWSDESQPYLKGSNSDYEVKAYINFPGSTAVGTPTAIKSLVWNDSGSGSSIRIYDRTNSNIIAELTSFSGSSPQLLDLGTLSNVPTGQAVFEVQTKKGGSAGEVRLASVCIEL